MKELIVLDFTSGDVHLHTLDDVMDEHDILEWIDDYGYSIGNIEWMAVKKIRLHDHRKKNRKAQNQKS